MPIYTFTCKSCQHQFDEILSIKELNIIEVICPKCSSTSVSKSITKSNFTLAADGRGFYGTKAKK